MLQNYNVVIADTTCFILLSKIGMLDILQHLFTTVTTTDIIAKEFGKPLPEWVDVNNSYESNYQDILQMELDAGEASAIALYYEYVNPLLILDDLKARKIAAKLTLNFTGTLGILLRAKQEGKIEALMPVLHRIQKTNFRFSDSVLKEILIEAGE